MLSICIKDNPELTLLILKHASLFQTQYLPLKLYTPYLNGAATAVALNVPLLVLGAKVWVKTEPDSIKGRSA